MAERRQAAPHSSRPRSAGAGARRLGSARVAGALWLATLAVCGVFGALLAATWGRSGVTEFDDIPAAIALYLVIFLGLATIGALLAVRAPANPIGWLFAASGLSAALGTTGLLYADLSLVVRPGSWPAGAYVGAVSGVLIPVGLFVLPLIALLLFPTGAPAPGWRWPVRGMVVIAGLGALGVLFAPGPLEQFPAVGNPLGLAGAAGRVATVLAAVFQFSAAPIFLLVAVSIASRFRRGDAAQRMQLKWVIAAGAVLTTSLALSFAASAVGRQGFADVFFVLGALALAALPVACAIAITRYRLYDIDRLVSRAVSYAALTVCLGVIYLGAVVTLQAVARPLLGETDVAVAGATLAAAAVVAPARRRIQHAVDRRFNRSRYDAEQAVAAFRDRLRREVELGEVAADLRLAVARTVQPRVASLWLAERER